MSGVRRLLSSLVVSAAALCLLCPPSLADGGDEAADKPRQIRLHGVVTRPDGTPAARCPVTFRAWGAPTRHIGIHTGSEGRYSVSMAATGRVILDAWADDIGQSKVLVADLAEGRESVRIDLPLRSLPVLHGTVFLPDGKPAANLVFEGMSGVSLDLDPLGGGRESSAGAAMLTLRTDGRGRFRTELLPRNPSRFAFGHGTRYLIHLASPQGWAGPIEVKLDFDQPDMRLDIQLRHGDRVEGIVVGYPGGKPLSGVDAEAAIHSGIMYARCAIGEAVSEQNGRFEIPTVLPPSEYDLGGHAKGWLRVSVDEQERVDTGAGSRVRIRI